MFRLLRCALIAACAALALAGIAQAKGGNYAFDGGTPKEQAQVRAALNASAFNWSLVPAQITVHIAPGLGTSDATPGELWLDSALLDSGVFAWGIVQHEYAHEVDFFLLDDAKRAALAPELGGQSWWQGAGAPLAHGQLSCERFASTLAWAYWPSARNSMKPQSKNDESSAMAPAAFRALMAQMLPAPVATAA
jgi:hypothetical protein